jgi:hypothetical protein
VPYIEVRNPGATIEHEATTSKISDDQLFYDAARAGPGSAVALIVNGFAARCCSNCRWNSRWKRRSCWASALKERGLKKTLTLKPVEERADAPKLRKGRGWNIAESRLDTLHDAAREMRRSPTPAQAALAAELAKADLGRTASSAMR